MDNWERSIDDRISLLEDTLRVNSKNLAYNLFKLGMKIGVFSYASNGKKSFSVPYIPNNEFLEKYLNASKRIGLLRKKNGSYDIGYFRMNFNRRDFENIIPEYIAMYDDIAAMAHYKAISKDHPNVLMSFGKDADVWDIFFSNPFCFVYREIIKDILKLKNGDRVLDVGCGSVAPVYFAELVGPNGCYRGIEKSKGLAKIANKRLRRRGMDWAQVKNIDFEKASVFGRYDYIICAWVINYLDNIRKGLKSLVSSVSPGGKIVFFDIFPDLVDFDVTVYEFYDSLNKSFKGFITSHELLGTLSEFDPELEVSHASKTFLIIEKKA